MIKKPLRISNKIISFENTIELAQELYGIYKKNKSSNKEISFVLVNKSEQSEEIKNIDELIKIFKYEKIQRFEYRFWDYKEQKGINIRIVESYFEPFPQSNSQLYVQGERNWVITTQNRIETIMNSWKSRNMFFVRGGLVILCLVIGFSPSILFFFYNNFSPPAVIFGGFLSLMSCFLAWLIIHPFWYYTFPSIEFDFGPPHLRKHKRIRGIILWIGSIVSALGLVQIFISKVFHLE